MGSLQRSRRLRSSRGRQPSNDSSTEERKPFLLEIRTYRYRGHSVADANHEKYRTKEEIEEYKRTKDPVNVVKQHLLSDGTLTEELAKKIDQEKKDEAEASAKFADESPVAPRSEIPVSYTHLTLPTKA